MIHTVTELNASPSSSPFDWSVFASDLEIPVGQIPRQLETSLGNKQPFQLVNYDEDCWNYAQSMGCITLKVWND
jgi:hypothetical protein